MAGRSQQSSKPSSKQPAERSAKRALSKSALSKSAGPSLTPEQTHALERALLVDQQLCFSLYTASRAMGRVYAPLLRPLGLTYAQYLVMLVLWETDSLSVRAIGERLELDSGTLTPLLRKLEKQGLVTRERVEGDQRVVTIALTRTGRELKARALTIPPAIACASGFDVAQPHSMEELFALRETLRALADQLLDR